MNLKIVARFLNQTHCYRCGSGLKGADVTLLVGSPMVSVIYVVCPHCGGELLATVSVGGHSVTGIRTDLAPSEVKKFFGAPAVSSDDVLDLHELVKGGSLWQGLKQKNEKYWEKGPKRSEERVLFPQSSSEKTSPPSPFA